MRPTRWLVPFLVASAVAVAGCADVRAEQARQAASAFSRGVAAGDFDFACTLLAPPTRQRLERFGSCASGLSQARLPVAGRVWSSQVWGSQAQVRLAGDTMFLTETEGHWWVAAAGCQSRGDAPYDCAVEGP